MTVSPELMLAILSMDFYNRGYDFGVVVDGDAIGTATVTARDTYVDDTEYAAWQAVGFSAVAYQWNGDIVISYRGTDNPNPLAAISGMAGRWARVIAAPVVVIPGFRPTQAKRRRCPWELL